MLYRTSDWGVYHCEQMRVIEDCKWVDTSNNTYGTCSLFPCLFTRRCIYIEHKAREIKVFESSKTALINPLPDTPEIVEQEKEKCDALP